MAMSKLQKILAGVVLGGTIGTVGTGYYVLMKVDATAKLIYGEYPRGVIEALTGKDPGNWLEEGRPLFKDNSEEFVRSLEEANKETSKSSTKDLLELFKKADKQD